MDIEEFPYCCTAKIICDFGGEYDDDEGDSVNEIISYINKRIPAMKQDGDGVAVCITTSNQDNANEALEKLGFYCSEKITKGRNLATGNLFVWFMPTHEFKPV